MSDPSINLVVNTVDPTVANVTIYLSGISLEEIDYVSLVLVSLNESVDMTEIVIPQLILDNSLQPDGSFIIPYSVGDLSASSLYTLTAFVYSVPLSNAPDISTPPQQVTTPSEAPVMVSAIGQDDVGIITIQPQPLQNSTWSNETALFLLYDQSSNVLSSQALPFDPSGTEGPPGVWSFTVTGLTNYHTYVVTCKINTDYSDNSVGYGALSTSLQFTPTNAPPTPILVTSNASSFPDAAIQLDWTYDASVVGGNTPETLEVWRRSTDPSTAFVMIAEIDGSFDIYPTGTYVDMDVSLGTIYEYYVVAITAADVSSQSNTAEGQASLPPSPPSITHTGGYQGIDVSFSWSGTTGGLDIAGFSLRLYDFSIDTVITDQFIAYSGVNYDFTYSDVSMQLAGAVYGDDIIIDISTVTVGDIYSDVQYSETVSAEQIYYTNPDDVTSLAASNPNGVAGNITWTAPTDTGGLTIDHYVVTITDVSDGLIVQASTVSSPFAYSDLSFGHSYDVSVQVFTFDNADASSSSLPPFPDISINPTDPPGQVLVIDAEVTSGELLFMWEGINDWGIGNPNDHQYAINLYDLTNDVSVVDVVVPDSGIYPADYSYAFSDLSNGDTYRVTIVAQASTAYDVQSSGPTNSLTRVVSSGPQILAVSFNSTDVSAIILSFAPLTGGILVGATDPGYTPPYIPIQNVPDTSFSISDISDNIWIMNAHFRDSSNNEVYPLVSLTLIVVDNNGQYDNRTEPPDNPAITGGFNPNAEP